MSRKANYAIKLSLEAADYLKNLARVQAVTATATRTLSRGFKFFSAAFLSTAAVRGMANMTGETMGTIVEIDRLSQSLGIAGEQLQVFQKASEFAGTSELNLGKALGELNRKRYEAIRGNKELRRTFGDVGISVEELGDNLTGDLFEQVLVNLEGVGSEAERGAIAFKLFGGEAEKMGGLLLSASSSIRGAYEEIARTGAALDRIDLAAVRITSEALGDLGDAWEVFKQKLVIGLSPVIHTIAQFLESKLLDPQFISSATKALSGFILEAVAFANRLPKELGVAWRQAAIELKSLQSFLAGGFLGADTPAVQETADDIARLRAEIVALEGEMEAGPGDAEGFFAKLAKELENIGSIGGGLSKTISPEIKRLEEDLEGVKHSIQDGLTTSLAEFITTGKSGIKELAQSILTDLVAALVRARIVMPLLGTVLGSGAVGGGILSTIFGGFMAGGGDVQPGKAYVVGEKRPELFVPRTAGRIEPDASRAMGGRGGDVYHIDARGADASAIARLENMIRALHGSVERRALAAVRDAGHRRAPGFA